jgi:hypothetical protein
MAPNELPYCHCKNPDACPGYPECYSLKVCSDPEDPPLSDVYDMIHAGSHETYRSVCRNAIEFAVACVEMNSVNELILNVSEPSIASDCKSWKISRNEWYWAVLTAKCVIGLDGSISDTGKIIV